jgi:catechol 2,3-dioxygenase-like lactoylglutathione lyase family enzyme
MTAPMISGVQACMIGVRDAEPLIAVFTDALGWETAGHGAIDRRLCRHLWGVDAVGEITVLAPAGVDHGRIMLLGFPGLDVPEAGEPPARATRLRNPNLYVRDMAEARRRVEAAGARWKAEVKFDIAALDGTVQTVHQARVELAGGAGLVFVIPSIARWTAAWTNNPEAFSTEFTSVVASVPDVDASKAFWGPEGLGLDIRYDITAANAKLNQLAGLEPDAVTRLAFGWGRSTSRVELLGRGADAYAHITDVDLVRRRRPGRSTAEVGWLLEVADLDSALARMTARGGRVVAAPAAGDSVLTGGGRVAAVEAPEGSLLTVIEK